MKDNEINMADLMQKLGSMMSGNEVPDEIKNMMKHFSSSTTPPPNTSNSSGVSEDFSFPDIDLDMMLKLKKVMDAMKTNKNDPRSNLLLSLKPYLKSSRRDKVDQYIQLFNMTKAFEVFNALGGDGKNGSK